MNIELTNLIYTRISHDLSNPAGALYNGVELLSENVSDLQEMTILLQNSATVLMARLKFFRQAFGLQNVTSEDATQDYLASLSSPVRLVGVCLDPLSKVCAMVLADCLIRGGTITVKENEITAYGDNIKSLPNLKEILEKGENVSVPALAPAYYAFYLAKRQNLKLSFSYDVQRNFISLKKVVFS